MNCGLHQQPYRWSCAPVLLAVGVSMVASAEGPTMKTYTFKTFERSTNQLKADVHRLPGFIHGGALMINSWHHRHEFITIPNGGHGFGKNDAEIAARTYGQAVKFLERHRGQ